MSQNYKDTLNLPRTEFPMKANLAAREPEMLRAWEETHLYRQIQKSREGRELFVLHDGPPFANGDVHMGTALNKILKDFVVKSQTMLGKRAPYVPGWDCHGLPIEYKVVKESRALSPLEVRKKSEAFARKFINIQREQFKRLGVFGDWEHPYLTMDPTYEAEILRAFAVFVEEGLVYQAQKPVFWSTGAQTALAEAEVEYQERDDTAVYVRFPIASGEWKDNASIAIWTTTPWTLPANLAIAVDPDETYVVQKFSRNGATETLLLAEKLVPQFSANTNFHPAGEPLASFSGTKLEKIKARHPFLDRDAIVLTADFVTMDSGTGAVHIAPGHGADDYALGMAKNLPILSPVDDHGRFTEEASLRNLTGKYVFDANRDIVELLREREMLLGAQKFHHSYPYCWRSKTPIIFRNVEQFFIRIGELRGKALDAIHNEVKWIPAWGENRIAGTVESRPDWVISRQRSWGVPLPVFYSKDGKAILDAKIIRKLADLVAERGSNIWFELSDGDLAKRLGLPPGTTKRNDTIDVWIDSGVSHRAVCALHPELRDPADMYLEATDQHRGWFQSSLLTSVALNNRAPYKICVTHGFVVDLDGKKISKSGTYEKPTAADHFVGRYGADLLRLWASSIDYTADVPFSEEMFTRLGDTYRRIRNTLRILLGNLYDFESGNQETRKNLSLIDRWILERMDEVIRDCRAAYESFEFHKIYHTLNQFCAVDLSSLYVDITKDRMYCDAPDSPRRRATQVVMHEIFDVLCRLLAPILAFTAEEAWRHSEAEGSVHLEEFPQLQDRSRDGGTSAQVAELLRLRSVIGQAIERARQEKLIGNTLEARVVLNSDSDVTEKIDKEELEEFFIVSDLTIHQTKEASVSVTKTPYKKCARCWRHRPTVGASKAHPDLCDRCESVVTAIEA
ncbi:MAG: isoleucine--tRNA ligase [Verrucomicrobia bacterium]|nr:MAG: isoleucine--tRNA ligase [Verrucomicrobiota bacterium]PYK07121.1 MAG: isoleucine--tRNA ligase [Verrucomicrobiota bacterium]PYK76233.1 MAG: isoleucine--tRNA ligase [Verrucomicrobiota bacterium]